MKDWINEERVNYFDLNEFVDKIKLSDTVKYHLEDTNENFESYIKALSKYCDYDEPAMLYYWLDSNMQELRESGRIENHIFKNSDLFEKGLFFENLDINHERIKRIHKFVCENSSTNKIEAGQYRKKEASVGINTENGYQPYWYGAKPEDIKQFMDSFIKFYKTKSLKEIHSNPFLKGALAHLLLVRIHPFGDGNGRTSRIAQNISFTSGINKIYGTKLKLSPLNISQNININKITYADTINKIKFNPNYDNNEMINRWFTFILNMYDEQLYFQEQRIPKLASGFEKLQKMLENNPDTMKEKAEKSLIKKLF